MISLFSRKSVCLAALSLVFTFAGLAQDATPSPIRPLITAKIDETKLVTLEGNTRPEARNPRYDRGPVAEDFVLPHMWLQLKRSPEQEQALELLMEQQRNPASPNYHKWLTPAEYGDIFGLAPSDIQTLTTWLQSHGFTVEHVFRNNDVIQFSGNAAEIREAFHTEIHNLNVRGEQHYGNISDQQIPAALAPAVIGVVSMNNFRPNSGPRMRMPNHVGPDGKIIPYPQPTAPGEPAPEYTQTTGNGGTYSLVPGDIQTIYNIAPIYTAGYTGTGMTIAVLEDSDAYSTADFTTYRSTFGLSQNYASGNLVTTHPSSSGATSTCTDPGDNSDDLEVELDIELATAVAPNATINLAACATNTNYGTLVALQNIVNGPSLPSVISMSYGVCEALSGSTVNAAFNAGWQQAAAEGISGFASSGDNGGAGCEEAENNTGPAKYGLNVTGWGESSYVTSVGGTDFEDDYNYLESGTAETSYWNQTNGTYYNSAKSYIPEIPWNGSCAGSLLAKLEGSASGLAFCNTSTGSSFLNIAAGAGGASSCYSGTPGTTGIGSTGTCTALPKPSWQSLVGVPGDSKRDVPDVSLFAANGLWGHYYTICYSHTADGGKACTGAPSGWIGIGGTSASTPVMASIQALINQKYGAQGQTTPTYYALANTEYGTTGSTNCNSSKSGGPASTCIFYDITQGDNDVPCTTLNGTAHNCYQNGNTYGVLSLTNTASSPTYSTGVGYDLATGIGSVNAYNLFTGWTATSMVATALSVTATPSPVSLGSNINIAATLTWTGAATAPSGVTYSIDGGTSASLTCSTGCSTSGAVYSAAVSTTGLAIGSHTVVVSYAGSSTYYQSRALTTFTVEYAPTTASISAVSVPYGSTTGVTVTATESGSHGVVTNGVVTFSVNTPATGSFSPTTCTLTSGGTCTTTYTPTGLLSVSGSPYSSIQASFAAVGSYGPATGTNTVTITQQTPTLVMKSPLAASPVMQNYGATTAFSVTSTLTWTGSGTAPTASDVVFSSTAGTFSTTTCGTTSPATCTSTFTPTAGLAAGTYNINVQYNGDTNYGTVAVTTVAGNYIVSKLTPTFGTMTFTPTSEVYGTSQTLSISDTLAYTGPTKPTGAVSFTLNSVAYPATCTGSSSPLTCTTSPVVPAATVAALAVNTYTVTASYTTDTDYAAATGTGSFSVTKATPTFGTMTFTPTSEVYGTSQTLSISDTLAYTGPTKPTGAVSFTLNSVAYPATCTGSSSPLTCTTSPVVPAATVAALAVNTYTVTASYTTDTNYAAATGTGSFSVTQSSPTAQMLSPLAATPVTQTFGELSGFTVTGRLVYSGSGAAPTVGDISFTSTAAGTFSNLSCSLADGGVSPYTCTATFTPTGTDTAVGSPYGINLSFSGDTNYASSVSAQTRNYVISPQTATFGAGSVTPSSVAYGTSQSVALSQVVDYQGIVPPSSAKYSFTLNGVSYTPSCTYGSGVDTCTYTVAGSVIAALPVGSYPVTLVWSPTADYNAFTQPVGTLTITADSATLVLSAMTPGSSTAGVASTVLNATLSPAVAGSTVTFTDSTTGATATATTNASGLATTTVTGTTAGANRYSASATATSTTSSAASNSVTVFYSGILVSNDTAEHTFSVDPGMYDGSPVCNGSNGTNGSTCSTPYGIVVSNFTSATQVITVTLNNAGSPSNAFSYATNCPTGGLAAGKTCNVQFYYLPPYGDGCTLNSNGCTQGTFESATWAISAPSQITGVGEIESGAATGSGATSFPSQLGGKALLAAGNSLSVTPTSLTFGPQAPGAVSVTKNVTVTNNGASSIGVTYTLPGGSFASTNGCAATLAAGATCQIAISYSDANVATDNANLVVTPASGSAITVTLTGTTTNNNGLSLNTTAHNFGSVTDGTTASFGLSITNNSTTTAATLSFNTSGSSLFTITTSNCPATLTVGASCQVQVAFTPNAPGAVSSALTITSNVSILPGGTGSGPYSDTVSFTGTGVAGGNFTASTAGHNYGTVAVGSAATPYGVTLTNSTSVALTLTLGGGTFASNGAADGYTVATNCGATLAVNASCQLQFSYTPTAIGSTSVAYPVTAVNGSTPYPLYSGGTQVSGGSITLSGTGN
jgi:subtilase family serine protease